MHGHRSAWHGCTEQCWAHETDKGRPAITKLGVWESCLMALFACYLVVVCGHPGRQNEDAPGVTEVTDNESHHGRLGEQYSPGDASCLACNTLHSQRRVIQGTAVEFMQCRQ